MTPRRSENILDAVRKAANAIQKFQQPGKGLDPWKVVLTFAYDAVPDASYDEIVDALAELIMKPAVIDDDHSAQRILKDLFAGEHGAH